MRDQFLGFLFGLRNAFQGCGADAGQGAFGSVQAAFNCIKCQSGLPGALLAQMLNQRITQLVGRADLGFKVLDQGLLKISRDFQQFGPLFAMLGQMAQQHLLLCFCMPVQGG